MSGEDFTSGDTVRCAGADPAPTDPFRYAAGNSLTFTDPTGHLISVGSPATNPNWQADTAYSNVFTQTWLTALVKTRLRRMQYQAGLIDGFLTGTRLDLTPLL